MFGHMLYLVPLEDRISSGVVATIGFGSHGFSPWPATIAPSIIPSSSA